jgi:heat shock protein HslJ
MERRRRCGVLGAAVALALLTAACGGSSSGDAVGPEGAWMFVSGTVDGVSLTPPLGTTISLAVSASSVVGRSSCNTFSGERVDAGGDALFPTLAASRMACPGDVFEDVYLGALGRVTDYEVANEQLRLRGDGIELRYVPMPAEPAASLVGSEWVLDTLYDGGTATLPVVPEPGRLNLRDDGVFSGFDGCQPFLGEWSRAIGTAPLSLGVTTVVAAEQTSAATAVHVVSFGVADPAAECLGDTGPMSRQVRQVLAADFTAIVTGLQLRLVTPSGLGVGYHTTPDGSVPPATTSPAVSTTTTTTSTTTATLAPATTTTVAPTTPLAPTTTVAPVVTAPPTTSTTTTLPATEYLPVPPPSVPGTTDDPPAGALGAGSYWAELTGLSGTTGTFNLYKAYFGQDCIDRFAGDPAEHCLNDHDVEPGVLVPVTVDLAVATITVSAPAPDAQGTIGQYRVSLAELGRLLAGQPPAVGAPDGYAYVPFNYLLTVRSGLVTAAEQVFTP